MSTVGECAYSKRDVLLPELEINEPVTELCVVESCVQTLYAVKHDTTDSSVASDTVIVRLRSHVGIYRHGVPWSVSEETLVCETIREYHLRSSERNVLPHGCAELIVLH